MKISPSKKLFNARDMLRFARYLTNGAPDNLLKHRIDCWFQGPRFDRKGIDWDKK